MHRKFQQLVLILLCAATALSAAAAEEFVGRVVGIADGDTIDVLRGGSEVTVRLHGVDTPESRQSYGKQAKKFTASMVYDRRVRVEAVDIDRYGRIVGIVYRETDGAELNEALVAAGYAWWYRKYAPQDIRLQELEQQARAAGKGLWTQDDPVAPWDWRRGVRSSELDADGDGRACESLP